MDHRQFRWVCVTVWVWLSTCDKETRGYNAYQNRENLTKKKAKVKFSDVRDTIVDDQSIVLKLGWKDINPA